MRFFYPICLLLLSIAVSSVVRSEETYSTDLPENFIDLSSDVQAVILEYVFFSEPIF